MTNSRPQKHNNAVWRRRRCGSCDIVFTTHETIDLSASCMFDAETINKSRPTPFVREKLLLSIYESCKHRPNAIEDTTALTQTIINKLFPLMEKGVIKRSQLVKTTVKTLRQFDNVAATMYAAYHPERVTS